MMIIILDDFGTVKSKITIDAIKEKEMGTTRKAGIRDVLTHILFKVI